MKLSFTQEWLRNAIEKYGDPEGCPKCGAIAGCCPSYPKCQETPEQPINPIEESS